MSSFWIDSLKNLNKNFESLNEDIKTDVCIIGGGITGISCAYYLSKAGISTTLLDKDLLSYKTTGNTTGKITSQHDLFYSYLINSFGLNFAKEYLQANENAIFNIEQIIKEENINCDFSFEDSYVFTQDINEIDKIKDEVKSMHKLDFPAEYLTTTPLPLDILAAIKFPKQAQFHPRKYLSGLVNSIIQNNGRIYENTEVIDIQRENSNYVISAKNNKVYSKYVIMATNFPILNFPGFYFMKMYQSTSYIIGVETNSKLFPGMYINSEEPTLSFRTAKTYDNKQLLLIGGSDHKTGAKINLTNAYANLEKIAKQIYPDCKVLYQWQTEDCISVDKIPYIGQFSSLMPNMFVATGYKKWGMTTSNIAANIITDMILGKSNKYSHIFQSTRFHPIKNHDEVKNILKETAYSLVINKTVIPPDTLSDINIDDGKLVEIDGKKVGIYKDSNGELHAIKPICSHLGCELTFNNLEKTWDCPCHGSRFDYTGKCIYGPSVGNLDSIDLHL